MNYQINILQGLGEVKFGMAPEETTEFLGKTDEMEEIDNGFGDSITVLHFHEHGVTLFFDSLSRKLSCIAVENEAATLFGENIFHKSEQEIVRLLVDNGFYEQDIETEAWGERRVSFGDGNIDLFFSENKLQSVTFGD